MLWVEGTAIYFNFMTGQPWSYICLGRVHMILMDLKLSRTWDLRGSRSRWIHFQMAWSSWDNLSSSFPHKFFFLWSQHKSMAQWDELVDPFCESFCLHDAAFKSHSLMSKWSSSQNAMRGYKPREKCSRPSDGHWKSTFVLGPFLHISAKA